MSRDHRKLRVFDDAHRLVLLIYRHTRHFPKDEWFGRQLERLAQRMEQELARERQSGP
ncbi:MAG TPA: hypothetical protein VND92_08660 [Vicinamibacterales bacterium]|nr:hypothetical protein [Vicinamibacterales bacterium]